MENTQNACGHSIAQVSYPGKNGRQVCTYCARIEYVERKKRPYAWTFGLAFLISWFCLPGAFFAWIWDGFGLGWRLFATGIIGMFAFGFSFSIIIETLQGKARRMYPDDNAIGKAFKN